MEWAFFDETFAQSAFPGGEGWLALSDDDPERLVSNLDDYELALEFEQPPASACGEAPARG